MLGVSPVRIFLWPAAPTGRDDKNWPYPCPPRPGRRRLGVSLSREGEPPVATAPRTPTPNDARHPLAGARPAVPTLPTPGGQGATRSWRDRRHGACTGRSCVGHDPGGACHTGKPHGPLARPLPRAPPIEQGCQWACQETQPRCGGTLGSVRRPSGETRPSMEAGTRRRQGRWEPTHGEPQDHPSSLPGSASLHA